MLVSITSSKAVAHEPFETVQRKVALVPTGTPVTDVLKEAGLVIVAVPEKTLHTPVPIAGAVAERVKVPELHWAMSVPAAGADGACLN